MTATTPCRYCPDQISYEPIAFAPPMPDILRPTVCPACEERRRSQASAEVLRRRYEAYSAICPPLYAATDIHHPDMPRADKLNTILAWKMGPIGLTVKGTTRKGKTRSMWLLVKRLIVEDGLRVTALTASQFASASASAAMENDHGQWKDSMLHDADVLFLDDLGKEKLTERVEADLFDVIETRTSNQKPILITTNYDGQTLIATKFSADRGPAIVSRIREFTTSITL